MSEALVRAAEFNRERLLARRFPARVREWSAQQCTSWARDFGAGISGELSSHDARWLDANQAWCLPMVAVPLCDGEFWEQEADTGIDWRRLVHAEERLTLHRPLPMTGKVVLSQNVTDIRDRGPEKGASMTQRIKLADMHGVAYADVDVTTVLRGNGGFGGPPPDARTPDSLPPRPPDSSVTLRTPPATGTSFCIAADLQVAGALSVRPEQRMLRGVGAFGIAGRAALALACGNQPERLRCLGVRYSGPLLTDEAVRFDLWRLPDGEGVFRLHATERDAPVLRGTVAWMPE